MKFNNNKGFTLIELLVVISIIALLSSVVFASLSVSRSKARDAKRISDVRQIRNALELYRNDYGSYPTDLTSSLVPTYIKSLPTDTFGTGTCRPAYCYAYNPATNPSSYHIGAQMENLGGVINSDSGFNSSGSYTGGFDGTASSIYDIKY